MVHNALARWNTGSTCRRDSTFPLDIQKHRQDTMDSTQNMTYAQFEQTHRNQLEQLGVPQHLWQRLHSKLASQRLDSGEHFGLMALPAEEKPKYRKYGLVATQGQAINPQSDIFLVDHLWTFDPHHARHQLESNSELAHRIENIIPEEYGLPEVAEEEEAVSTHSHPTDIPKVTSDETQQQQGEQNDDEDDIDETLVDQLVNHCGIPHSEAVELLRRHEWELVDAITHADRRKNGISDDHPDHDESPMLRDLREQITRNVHQQQQAKEDDEAQTRGTRRRRQPTVSDLTRSERLDRILDALVGLRFTSTYDILIPQEQSGAAAGPQQLAAAEKYFFIPDEVGSSILHDSTTPNVKMDTFIFNTRPDLPFSTSHLMPFSIFYPIRQINEGDFVTRDYTDGITAQREREEYLAPIVKA